MTVPYLSRLYSATRIEVDSFERVRYWVEKHRMLLVALGDFEALAKAVQAATRDAPAYEGNPRITLPDPTPGLRLSLAVESVCGAVYGMTEIAANFGNRITDKSHDGRLPKSFNELKKKVRGGRHPVLATTLGDLRWHDTLHAMRTEWVHFSTIFLGEDGEGHPVIVGADLRYASDTNALSGRFQVTLEELRELAMSSLVAMDRFAGYLFPFVVRILLARFPDLDEVVNNVALDKQGMPIVREDHTFAVEQITRRQQLERLGLADMLPPRSPE